MSGYLHLEFRQLASRNYIDNLLTLTATATCSPEIISSKRIFPDKKVPRQTLGLGIF